MPSMRARRRRKRISKAARARVMAAVRSILAPISPGGRLQFLHTSKGSLGGISPMRAISVGRVKAVIIAATGFAER